MKKFFGSMLGNLSMLVAGMGLIGSLVAIGFGVQKVDWSVFGLAVTETAATGGSEEEGEGAPETGVGESGLEDETGAETAEIDPEDQLAKYVVQEIDETRVAELAVAPVLIEPETLQEAVDVWLASYRHGDVGIEVLDVDNRAVVARYRENARMRPRSLYKLFYYYDAYAQVDAGADDLNQDYADGKNLATCLDAMIRYSNNPCAEKMYNDPVRQGRVGQLIQHLGLSGTQADGLMTTAHDMAVLLQYYYAHPGWSESSWQKFRESALNQPYNYRKGLPSGFRQAAVYDKAGWGTDGAGVSVYNDAAMVEIGGRRYIVVVMTTQTNYAAIGALGGLLESVMLKM